jgi:hypothetical protein
MTTMKAPSGRLFELAPSEETVIPALKRLGWEEVKK